MSPVEVAGFVLSLAMVYCNIRQIHWGWPLALVSSGLYFQVFWDSRLYGEAALQLMFMFMAVWGWWQWLRSPSPSLVQLGDIALDNGADARSSVKVTLQISSLSRTEFLATLVVTALTWPLLAYFLQHYTDTDVAIWDGLVCALSLAGQYLLGRKKLENWAVWWLVNSLTIGLMLYKLLWLTAILYLIFAILSWLGWRAWHSEVKVQSL